MRNRISEEEFIQNLKQFRELLVNFDEEVRLELEQIDSELKDIEEKLEQSKRLWVRPREKNDLEDRKIELEAAKKAIISYVRLIYLDVKNTYESSDTSFADLVRRTRGFINWVPRKGEVTYLLFSALKTWNLHKYCKNMTNMLK